MTVATCARILPTLYLLALATSASAEGAWVLWSQLYTPGAGDWVMQTAYSTATECTEAIDYRGADAEERVHD